MTTYPFTIEPTERGPRIVIPIGGEAFVFSINKAAELRDSLSMAIVASGRTTVQLNADTLIGALRHTLALCDEMKKQSSAEVARIYQFVIAHVRSSMPEAMRAAMEGM